MHTMFRVVSREQFHPLFLQRLIRLGESLVRHGLIMRITDGYRDPAKQAALYAQGRYGDKRPRVTWAKPGKSPHEYRLAADFCFDGAPDPYQGDWALFGRLVKEAGLEWGGYWSTYPIFKRDRPHVQMPGWKRLR